MKTFADLLAMCRQGLLDVRSDSRLVEKGDIFVAPDGQKSNAAVYIADAIKRGAAYVICSLTLAEDIREAGPDCQIIGVDNSHRALEELAKARFGTEQLSMQVIGITGTNGKTTCAWLLEYFFSCLGHKTGLLGTIEYHWPGFREPAPLTTPGLLQLHAMLGQMQAAGVDTVIMEVSSHALAQGRVAGIDFSGAIFTNLTQDHLDYHRDMETYFRAKAKLFLQLPKENKAMALNADNHYGRRLIELLPKALSFGLHKRLPGLRHLWGDILSASPAGMSLRMSLADKNWQLDTPLIGAFNAANLLAVQALCLELGFAVEDFSFLGKFTGVPGRLERISNNRNLNVFVDYAHTPDALSNALRALRGAGFGKIITVFGCGGNRDRDKRPLMGKAVAENSDIAILTSDNPRHEDPENIMRDVKPGLIRAKRAFVEVDRRKATALALKFAKPEDAVLIAGKGHENYQIIGDVRNHYSDQEVIMELLG